MTAIENVTQTASVIRPRRHGNPVIWTADVTSEIGAVKLTSEMDVKLGYAGLQMKEMEKGLSVVTFIKDRLSESPFILGG